MAVGEDDQRSLSFTQGRVIVGRGRGADVHLTDTSISGQHVALENVGGHWTATDLDSTNGSWFAGSRLIPGRPTRMDASGPLQVGTVVLPVVLEAVAQDATNAQTQSLARALLRAELAAEGQPCEGPSILVLSELGQGMRYTFKAGDSIVVGRGEDCALSIPDAELSREHLRIAFDAHTLQLTDQNTKNGSRIGGRIFEQTTATGGDHIHIGATTLLVEDPVEDLLKERVELPDTSIPLARASRVPPARVDEVPNQTHEGEDDALVSQRRNKEKGNRKLSEPGEPSPTIAGGDRLLLAFALVLVFLSVAGLWLLFR